MSKRMIDYWVIPPECDAEFVTCMEEVLETYEKPYAPKHPVICMDEQPVQLLKETRQPIEATLEHPRRVDYAYERNGVCEPDQPGGHTQTRQLAQRSRVRTQCELSANSVR